MCLRSEMYMFNWLQLEGGRIFKRSYYVLCCIYIIYIYIIDIIYYRCINVSQIPFTPTILTTVHPSTGGPHQCYNNFSLIFLVTEQNSTTFPERISVELFCYMKKYEERIRAHWNWKNSCLLLMIQLLVL